MIVLSAMVLLFHVFILAGVIPYSIVWAGKISTRENMMMFEAISIFINALLIIILLLKVGYIQNKISRRKLQFVIWCFIILFGLNTIGNLFAKSRFELYCFTALAFLSTVLCLRIVVDKGEIKNA